LRGSLTIFYRTSSLTLLVPSVSPLSVVIKSYGLPPTIPLVLGRTAPLTSLSRLLPTSALPQTSTSGVRPTVMKPPPPISSLSSRRPPRLSSLFPARTFQTSRDQRSRGRPRVDTLSTRRKMKPSQSSVAEVRSPSPSRLLPNSRQRASRPGLSPSLRGRSSIGRRKVTN